jgi:hypothetical protein
MSFWKKLFGLHTEEAHKEEDVKSHQLPSSMVAQEFGEVNVARRGDQYEVRLTILMEPSGADAEGWQTGVALDASASMKDVFGRGLIEASPEDIPSSLLKKYVSKGWLTFFDYQGDSIPLFSYEAEKELVEKGYFTWSKNEIEPLAREMTAYLASNLDADGGTTVIYWACGDGAQIEVLGDFTAEECEGASFTGPSSNEFGSGTVLAPAVKYFADRFSDAKHGMYIFITDGEIHDLDEVKSLTIRYCREIERKKRNPLKCVLIGIGDGINEEQMEELDDLESGTNVDIWDHKIAKDMRSLIEIFAEVVSENQIVAPTGRIFDASGQVVKNFADGVPASISFSMPSSSDFFELEVMGQRIRQSIIRPPR